MFSKLKARSDEPEQESFLADATNLAARQELFERYGMGEERAARMAECYGEEREPAAAATRWLRESPKLVEHLGRRGAAKFAKRTVTLSRAQWARRADPGFLTEQETEEMHEKAHESTYTVESRAAFFVLFTLGKHAEKMARQAIATGSVPDDPEVRLEVMAGVLLSVE